MSHLWLMFLQEAGEVVAAEPSRWLGYLAVVINTALVPMAVQLLKPLWAAAPAAVKTFVPMFAGSALTMATAWLSTTLGAPVDLSALTQIFMGAAIGLSSSLTFKAGQADEAKDKAAAREKKF